MIKAVAYIRCSTDLQEDSPEQQKKDILKFAEEKKFQVVEWFVDFGKSGTTFEQRPEFQRLKREVENSPEFKAVICYDSSRWSRAIDPEEGTFYRVWFKKHGVEVLFVKTSVDPKNEFAPMLQAFEGIQASSYSKKLSELTLRGAKNNGIYSSGGTAPYAYRRVSVNMKTGQERELTDGEYSVRNQEKVKWALGMKEEIEVVRNIFEQRAKGTACVLIAQELNERNLSCPKRGRWRNKDQKWSAITIKTILENPAYYGARVYNRNSMSKIQAQAAGRDLRQNVRFPHWKNDKNEWTIVENAHPAIVSNELWIKVNSLSRNTNPNSKPRHFVPYLLTGLIHCSECGFPFQGQSTRAKKKNYFRYVCGGYNSKRVCSYKAIGRDKLECFVVNAVKDVVCNPLVRKNIEKNLEILLLRNPQRDQREKEHIEKEISENETKTRRLIQAIEQGIKLEEIYERLQELDVQRKNLLVHNESFVTENSENRGLDVVSEVKSFFLGFESEFNKASIHHRKELVRKCVSKIEVDKQKNVVRCYVRKIPITSVLVQNTYMQLERSQLTHNVSGEFRNLDSSCPRYKSPRIISGGCLFPGKARCHSTPTVFRATRGFTTPVTLRT